jgi:hypothetical protein
VTDYYAEVFLDPGFIVRTLQLLIEESGSDPLSFFQIAGGGIIDLEGFEDHAGYFLLFAPENFEASFKGRLEIER